jgi:hypothetical protein
LPSHAICCSCGSANEFCAASSAIAAAAAQTKKLRRAGPTVREAVYPKAKVMAYVMPPTYVLEDMAAAARAAATASK